MTNVFKNMDRVEVSNNKEDWFLATFIGLFNGEYIAVRDISITPLCKGIPSQWLYCRYIRPDWPVDHPIQVKDFSGGEWVNRHFSGWDDNGMAKAWRDGATKHTAQAVRVADGSKILESPWRYWREVPE